MALTYWIGQTWLDRLTRERARSVVIWWWDGRWTKRLISLDSPRENKEINIGALWAVHPTKKMDWVEDLQDVERNNQWDIMVVKDILLDGWRKSVNAWNVCDYFLSKMTTKTAHQSLGGPQRHLEWQQQGKWYLSRLKFEAHIPSDAEVSFGPVLWGFSWTWNWTYGSVQANVWTLDQTIGLGPVQVRTCLNL